MRINDDDDDDDDDDYDDDDDKVENIDHKKDSACPSISPQPLPAIGVAHVGLPIW